MSISVVVSALDDAADYFRAIPEIATRAASMAINTVAERQGLRLSREEITKQVNFPSGYLTGDRLEIRRKATQANLEAVIVGRDRGTSLARFSSGGQFGKGGVTVQVHRGNSSYLKKAFLVKLKQGSASVSDGKYNVGLAIRLKPGERLANRYKGTGVKMGNTGLYLLYGPSVDQVFSDVADKISPRLLVLVGDEFFRNFERLSRE